MRLPRRWSSAASWSRRPAQEPGAAVRHTLPGRVDRPSKRQFGARMPRSADGQPLRHGAQTEQASSGPDATEQGVLAPSSRHNGSQVNRAQPGRPAPPFHPSRPNGRRGCRRFARARLTPAREGRSDARASFVSTMPRRGGIGPRDAGIRPAGCGRWPARAASRPQRRRPTPQARRQGEGQSGDRQRPRTRCSASGPRRSRCRRSTASSRALHAGVRPGVRRELAEIAAIAGERRQADVRQHHRGAGAGRATGSIASASVFFNLAGTDTNEEIQAIERDAGAALCQARHAHLPERQAVRAASMRCSRSARQARPERGADARAGALSPQLRQSPAPALDAKAEKRMAAIAAAPGHARHASSARTCWPTSRPSCWCWRRGGPGRPARRGARGGGADGQRARPQGQARHHAGALQHRAVPAVLGAARPAREGVQGLAPCAAPTAARPTTARSSPRSWGCGPSARACSASRRRPMRRSNSPWPRRRPTCASC